MGLKLNKILQKKQQWLIVFLVGVLLVVIAIPSEKQEIEEEQMQKTTVKNRYNFLYVADGEKIGASVRAGGGCGRSESDDYIKIYRRKSD